MNFKKRKRTKKRASTFHGYGRGASHHKGSGNKGGKGRAGSGKKSDGKKPSFWKEVQGRHGFNANSRFNIIPINIDKLARSIPEWEKEGIATKKGTGYFVDLTKTCYNKLLSSGTTSIAFTVKVDYASKGAGAKLGESGGSIEVLKVKVKKQKKKAAAPKKKAEKEAPAAQAE